MIVKSIWKFIRTLSGDNAYEKYLENIKSCKKHNELIPLSSRDFYQKRIDEKWNKINRCC